MTLNSANPGPRWVHLGKRFVLARELMGLSRAEAARKSGIHPKTLQEFENGPWPSSRRKTATGKMLAYADFLGWTPDSADAVLAGGEPTQRVPRRDHPGAEMYAAIASGATAEQIVEIGRAVMGSDMAAEHKAMLMRALLGPNG